MQETTRPPDVVQGAGGDRKRTSREPAVPPPTPRATTAPQVHRRVQGPGGSDRVLEARRGRRAALCRCGASSVTPGHWWRWLSHAAGRRPIPETRSLPTSSPSRAGRGGARGAGKRLRASGRAARAQGRQRDYQAMIEQTVEQLTPIIGTRPACRNARTSLAELHSERFSTALLPQVWATLLDEGRYQASARRILAAQGEGGERRNQLVHPPSPELLAKRVNEVWSISKLRGPAKWTYFYLYVILEFQPLRGGLDSPAPRERSLGRAAHRRRCSSNASDLQLTIHADLDAPSRSARRSRHQDTLEAAPYSEAHFRTLKYRPEFPARLSRSNTILPLVQLPASGSGIGLSGDGAGRTRPADPRPACSCWSRGPAWRSTTHPARRRSPPIQACHPRGCSLITPSHPR